MDTQTQFQVTLDLYSLDDIDDGHGLALLLADDVAGVNSCKKADGRWGIVLYANCNDIFAWGCSDAEDIEGTNELDSLVRAHVNDRKWGVAKWCAKKRGCKPQFPVEQAMRTDGSWDDEMEQLKPNPFDEAWKRQKEGKRV